MGKVSVSRAIVVVEQVAIEDILSMVVGNG